MGVVRVVGVVGVVGVRQLGEGVHLKVSLEFEAIVPSESETSIESN